MLKDTESSKKESKENVWKNKTVAEIKNIFNKLMSRLETAKERISEPENVSTETSQIKMQREQKKNNNKKKTIAEYPRTLE